MLKFRFIIMNKINKYFGTDCKLSIYINQVKTHVNSIATKRLNYFFFYKIQLKDSDKLEVSDERIHKINIQNQTIDIAISGIPVPVTVSKTSLLNPSVRRKLKINRDNFLAICHKMELKE